MEQKIGVKKNKKKSGFCLGVCLGDKVGFFFWRRWRCFGGGGRSGCGSRQWGWGEVRGWWEFVFFLLGGPLSSLGKKKKKGVGWGGVGGVFYIFYINLNNVGPTHSEEY